MGWDEHFETVGEGLVRGWWFRMEPVMALRGIWFSIGSSKSGGLEFKNKSLEDRDEEDWISEVRVWKIGVG